MSSDEQILQQIMERINEIHSVCPSHPVCSTGCPGPALTKEQENQRDTDNAFISFFHRSSRFSGQE